MGEVLRIPTPELLEAIRKTVVQDQTGTFLPIKAMEIGTLATLVQTAGLVCDRAPIAMGLAELATAASKKRKLATSIAQSAEEDVDVMKDGQVRGLFAGFDGLNGGNPLLEE